MNRKYQLAYELTNTQQLYPHVMSQLNFFFKKICFFFLLCFVLSKFNYYSRHNRCESMDYYNIFIPFVLFLLVEICPSLYMSTWEIKKKAWSPLAWITILRVWLHVNFPLFPPHMNNRPGKRNFSSPVCGPQLLSTLDIRFVVYTLCYIHLGMMRQMHMVYRVHYIW